MVETAKRRTAPGPRGHPLLGSIPDFRRDIIPAFHRQRLAAFGTMMAETTAEMLEPWQSAAGAGKPLDLRMEMMRLTLTILAKAMFSTNVAPEAEAIGLAVSEELEYANMRLLS